MRMLRDDSSRGPWRVWLVMTLLLALGPACGRSRGPAEQPAWRPTRIVLITIDTLRADHLGAYGYPRNVSPFLDSLAADSVVFVHALSSSSHTAPSHASLFTSLYPAQHRLLRNGELLAEELWTVAEMCREAGYVTAGFTPVRFLTGLSQGFDEFVSGEVYAAADEVLGWARDWLAGQDPDQPVFLWIHLFDVHEWYQERHVNRQAVEQVSTVARLQGRQLVDHLEHGHGLIADRFPGRRPVVETMNLYDGQLWSLDRELDRFHAWMEEHQLYQDSLWIVTSDHGEGLGNHGFLGHGKHIYNEQLLVPLLFHAADGRFRPGRVEAQVQLVDVAPTLAAMIGGRLEQQPVPVVGRSLLGLLGDPSSPWQVEAAFAQRRPADAKRIEEGWPPGEVFAFQDGRRKVIVHLGASTEIYDLERDRFEHVNLTDPSDEQQQLLVDSLIERFDRISAQGNAVSSSEIQPEFVDELKALGYL